MQRAMAWNWCMVIGLIRCSRVTRERIKGGRGVWLSRDNGNVVVSMDIGPCQ